MKARTTKVEVFRDPDGTLWVERFSRGRRLEHLLVIITFTGLVLTGFPQRFYNAEWAHWLLDLMGGLTTVRTIHRALGLVFTFHAVVHIATFCVGALTRRMHLSMLPLPSDLRDMWRTLAYDLGFRRDPPDLPKFDYRQKFEYIGIVLGGLVMVFSGLILLWPVITASFLPGEVIPAARVAHSNEAMLALSVLIVWHVYGSHLSPKVWPGDKTIFTGKIPLEELQERHAREYRRLFGDQEPHAVEPTSIAQPPEQVSEAASAAE